MHGLMGESRRQKRASGDRCSCHGAIWPGRYWCCKSLNIKRIAIAKNGSRLADRMHYLATAADLSEDRHALDGDTKQNYCVADVGCWRGGGIVSRRIWRQR